MVLPLFALSNAGVRFVGGDFAAAISTPIALGVLLGLVVGKPLGIALMSLVAVKLRVADLPEGVGWPQLLGAGLLGGIGFTMSLFVASLAFRGTAEINEAKMAILLASVIAGVAGFLVLRFALRAVGRRTPRRAMRRHEWLSARRRRGPMRILMVVRPAAGGMKAARARARARAVRARARGRDRGARDVRRRGRGRR